MGVFTVVFYMIKTIFTLIIFCILLNSNAMAFDEYKLGAGDTISVTVFNEPDMSVSTVKIPMIGKVTFPYIGDIKVSGLTLRKLKGVIVKRLKKGYLKKPQLVINILEYRPFFVNGEVNAPGGYPYVEGLTIRKAIAISGGLTDRASLRKLSLISENGAKKKKNNRSLEGSMNPGDILTIGEALF